MKRVRAANPAICSHRSWRNVLLFLKTGIFAVSSPNSEQMDLEAVENNCSISEVGTQFHGNACSKSFAYQRLPTNDPQGSVWNDRL